MKAAILGVLLASVGFSCSASTKAAQPSAAKLTELNRTLNASPTPDSHGLSSTLKTDDINVDQKGNRIFIKTPVPSERAPSKRVAPQEAFQPLAQDLRDFEARVKSSEQVGAISNTQALGLREKVELLKIKHGLNRKPDGSGMRLSQIKSFRAELKALQKGLPL